MTKEVKTPFGKVKALDVNDKTQLDPERAKAEFDEAMRAAEEDPLASLRSVDGTGNVLSMEDYEPDNPVKTIRNRLKALGISVSYNEFEDRYIASDRKGKVVLDDKYIKEIWGGMVKDGHKFSIAAFSDLVEVVALKTKVHPIKEYLDGLQWDGVNRLDTWLQTYAGVDVSDPQQEKYVSGISRVVFIAAVRRIKQPGCKFDEVLLLEGPQGCFKSTLIRKMAKQDEWFTDNVSLTDGAKVIIENTRGKWIVEFAEMKGIRKADSETIKSNLSRQVDSARLAYARFTSDVKRQFIFIGTTNVRNSEDKYFTDQTGNRRYWPVKVGTIDVQAFERDIDQLWAEAVKREGDGESIHLGQDTIDAAKKEQEGRVSESPIMTILTDYFTEYVDKEDDEKGTQTVDCAVRVDDVRQMLSSILKGNVNDREMGIVMKELGYEKLQVRWEKYSKKCVYRKNKDSKRYTIEGDGKRFKLMPMDREVSVG